MQVLGYLCGLQSLVCSCHALTSRQMDKKLEQSSTQFTLQTAAASRAVTSDTIAARPPRLLDLSSGLRDRPDIHP